MRIAIIGAGAMGGAMAEGWLACHNIAPADITVSNPTEKKLEKFALKGASVTTDNKAAIVGADVVAVVVKPWIIEDVLKEIKPGFDPASQILLVVAAGVTLEQIQNIMGVCSTFLVIPNIAMAQKASMTFLVPHNASDADIADVQMLFNMVGLTMITTEKLLPAATTLASCGLAYAMRYVRAAAEGGVELGFKADDATRIVLQTVMGAVQLLQKTGMHPEQAIDLVTTPGGVTIRGLNEMEHSGFSNSVIQGLKAGIIKK